MYQVEGTVPSVVLDTGSHTVKAGLTGDDLPDALIPSYLIYDVPEGLPSHAPPGGPASMFQAGFDFVTRARNNVEVTSPFNADGLIENWSQYEALVAHTLQHGLHVDGSENGILFAEPNHNGRVSRERLTELFFETFQSPAIYLARSAVLAAYASGRTTGVVLDMGHSSTSAVPVLEGSIVRDKFLRTPVAGKSVSNTLMEQLKANEKKTKPLWSFKRTTGPSDDDTPSKYNTIDIEYPNVRTSFKTLASNRILEDAKAGICRAFERPRTVLTDLPPVPEPVETWELPDGETVTLGNDRFIPAEQTIFGELPHASIGAGPDKRLSYVQQLVRHTAEGAAGPGVGVNGGAAKQSSAGVDGLVLDAIHLLDVTTHRDMYAGVCLTGGTSDMGGVYERLTAGLAETYHKVRVLAATGSMERKHCAWTGGSILGTFSEFQKMWFSKSEYDENGASFIHKKCT